MQDTTRQALILAARSLILANGGHVQSVQHLASTVTKAARFIHANHYRVSEEEGRYRFNIEASVLIELASEYAKLVDPVSLHEANHEFDDEEVASGMKPRPSFFKGT